MRIKAADRHAGWCTSVISVLGERQGQGRGDEFEARLATQGEPVLQNKEVKYNRHS